MINKGIFRQYDIRGIVETDLQDENLSALAKGFAIYFLKKGERVILLGYDNRISSEHIRDILFTTFQSFGLKVIDIGCVITPMFYFAARTKNYTAGVMITASHNSGEYNGFKVYHKDSTIYGDEILDIYKIIEDKSYLGFHQPELESKAEAEKLDILPDYEKYILEKVQIGTKPLKIGLDCGNGTASLFATKILESFGVEVFPIYCTSDPTFPNHFPDPVNLENCKDLSELVIREKLDCGIGFDGDGDRVGLIDNKGNPVWGDMIMVLLTREILKKNPNATVICEVKCSQLLVDDIIKNGGNPIVYKTGHSLIKAKMKETGAICAGEMSGHIFLKDEYFGFDDAIYAALRILRILSNTQKNLSSLLSNLEKTYVTPEIRVKVTEETKFQLVENAKKYLGAKYEALTIDGVRAIIKDGWGLIRASNTGPVLVMRAEAKTQENLDFIKKELENALK
ncbi:MAG: phosphomannomutase/phosphoglucomutase [Caldisericia bacterium]|nr:phosphomannomutase/phosphoglucomutase [Caldisericia bacterium]